MTKAEFIKRLEDRFRGIIEDAKSRAIAEIKGSRARMDAQTFADWLRSKMAEANAEPALRVFDVVLRPSHSTPQDAADSLAGLVEMDVCHFVNDAGKLDFDPNRVNWQEQWKSAAPLLSNSRPERADGWKYRQAFAQYIAAARAEARAGIFAAEIEETTDTGKPRPRAAKAEPPAFAHLFESAEAMQKALEAARGIDPPMIYANDQWTEKYKKLPGLHAFYDFCNDREYLRKSLNKKSAIDAMSLFFMGEDTGKNALQTRPDVKLKERLIRFGRP